jgi:hypothetical protein
MRALDAAIAMHVLSAHACAQLMTLLKLLK